MKPALALVLFSPLIMAQANSANASFATKLGPSVGSKTPTFEAKDQFGHAQSFATLRGPKGLILVFIRSADW